MNPSDQIGASGMVNSWKESSGDARCASTQQIQIGVSENWIGVPASSGLRAISEIVPNSRSKKHGSAFRVSCDWRGQHFEAVSRSGASHALCRQLVEAGVPDGPMSVFGTDGKLHYTIRSIHEAAGHTYAESSTHSLQRVRYNPRPAFAATRESQISASEPSGVLREGSEPAAEKTPVLGKTGIGDMPEASLSQMGIAVESSLRQLNRSAQRETGTRARARGDARGVFPQ
jgi:hypothetical protein